MEASTDVLICGAGAAGLTLAIDLARRGVRFRLIDRLLGPFAGSRGKGIQPRTQEILEDLGVLDRAVAAGGPYPAVRHYAADGSAADIEALVQPQAASTAEPYRMPLMIPQFLMEAVLRERLCELGAAPAFGTELIDFAPTAEGIRAMLKTAKGEHVVQARYLVGADGGRSFVRKALGIDFPGESLGVRALVADVRLQGLDRAYWHQFGRRTADALAICPLAGTDLFQLQGPIPPEGEIDLSATGLEALTRQRTGRQDIVLSAVAWASAYAMSARLAARYRHGRAFLIGDAAHVHPPTGGQGLNTSVQDAYNLGWKLAAAIAGAPETLLDTYEEERRPIAMDMLGLSTRLLDGHRRGDNRRGREVQQLDLGYAGASLALAASARPHGPVAGERAPDALLMRASGQRVRLFDLLAGPHWTLIGFHTDPGAVPPRAHLHLHRLGDRGDLADPQGCFAETYRLAPGDWLLIRPDGYIGAVVPSDDLAALESYLARVGLRSPAVR